MDEEKSWDKEIIAPDYLGFAEKVIMFTSKRVVRHHVVVLVDKVGPMEVNYFASKVLIRLLVRGSELD